MYRYIFKNSFNNRKNLNVKIFITVLRAATIPGEVERTSH